MASFEQADAQNMDERQRLAAHFKDVPSDQQTSKWDGAWQNKITPWDRSTPSPALIDTLKDKTDILGSPYKAAPIPTVSAKRKKAFVPGCGRGYDVLLLASHGYDAYGLDVSKTATEAANALAKEEASKGFPSYPLQPTATSGWGNIKFLQADFFKDGFLKYTDGGDFDVIYDYTFLCALPPALRPAWAKRMSELLASEGRLVCLEFPLAKPPSSGGPPHGLSSELYVQLFKQPGNDVEYGEDGYAVAKQDRESGDGALERVAHWKPERTHAAGKDSDMVSVWRHVQR